MGCVADLHVTIEWDVIGVILAAHSVLSKCKESDSLFLKINKHTGSADATLSEK